MAGKPRSVPNRTKKDIIAYTQKRARENDLTYSDRAISRVLNRLVDIIIEKLAVGHCVRIGAFGVLSVEQYRANGHVLVRVHKSQKNYRMGTQIRNSRGFLHYNLTDLLCEENGNIALSGLVVMGLCEFAYRVFLKQEKLEIRGLGTFYSKDKHLPDRKKPIQVPAFKTAISLRDRINAQLTAKAKKRLKTYEGRD